MNGKKILITGGLGNLGSWLTMHFSKEFDIYVLSKNAVESLDVKYTLIQADITNIKELEEQLSIDFDYCIHTASYNEFFHENYPKNALLINSLGTRNLIEVLKNKNIKNFIYLSTFHVYGKNNGHITENTNLMPLNDYASTHLFAEYYIKQFFQTDDFPFTIFRLTNSYGAPKYHNSSKWYLVLNDLVKGAYINNEITLKGNGKATRDFIWMGDVCSIIEKSLILNPNENNIFNLSSNTCKSMLELAKKVQNVYINRYKKNIDIILNENDTTMSLNLNVCNNKVKTLLDFTIRDEFENEINKIFDLLEDNHE